MDDTSLTQHSYALQARFAHALYIVHSMFSNCQFEITQAEHLTLRCLERQALEGDCTQSPPSPQDHLAYVDWDEWHCLKGMQPFNAQQLYINLVCDILARCSETYRDHPQAVALCDALHYLGSGQSPTAEDSGGDDQAASWSASDHGGTEIFVDALDDTELGRQADDHSPGPSALTASSGSMGDCPLTPDFAPFRPHDMKYIAHPPSGGICVQPVDFLPHDTMSDADTIDREVAAATSDLRLASPCRHPYYTTANPHYAAIPSENRLSRSSLSRSSRHRRDRSGTSQSYAFSERVLESLQTDVTALSEQIDHLRRTMNAKEVQKRQMRWTWLWLAKTVAKHALVNFLILLLVFLVLWKRRSPIAYAIIGFVGPQIKDIVYYLVRRVAFWKVTV